MSLRCPFCHSTNVILVEASKQQSNTTLTNLVTPTTLGALGTTVAKSFNLPPIVGGIAGTVLGSVEQMQKTSEMLGLPSSRKKDS